jgi:hypothetical protein
MPCAAQTQAFFTEFFPAELTLAAIFERETASKGRPSMNKDQVLRDHLLYLLRGGDAHLHFDAAVADLLPELRGARAADVRHTAWRLLEHMRIAQWDILEFSRNAKHVSPPFPEGYWPKGDAPPDAAAWDRCLAAFRADLQAMQDLVADPSTDLFAPIPHGEGQTILREALLVADHNAYHLGQLIMLRRVLGAWPE